MTNLHHTLFFVTSVIVLSLLVFPVFAQVVPIEADNCSILGNCSGDESFGVEIFDFTLNIVDILQGFIAVLAAIFLVVAAFLYITSTGDAEKAEKAKKQIIYALLGVALSGAVWIIVFTVRGEISTLKLINVIGFYGIMLTLLVNVIAAFYLVIAAVMYITSTGDAEKAERAKRQVIYALLGVALSGAVWFLVNAVDPATRTTGIAEVWERIWFYGNMLSLTVGTLAAFYLVIAAVMYITSTGDAEKAERAKRQVIYALLGVALSGAVWFLVDTVDPLERAGGFGLADLIGRIEEYRGVFLSLVGILAAIYIIYAGYKYISSSGDEEEAATAKRQITFALIGVFIAGAASAIIKVVDATNKKTPSATDLISDITSVINAILSLLALIATVYVILGGVMYLSSQGDQEKATRAKMQVIYALIGIAIIALSAVLVNFIIDNL